MSPGSSISKEAMRGLSGAGSGHGVGRGSRAAVSFARAASHPASCPAARMSRVRPHHMVTRILSTALITAGLVVLADAGVTLLWEEPVSAAYGSLQQGRASDELDDLESSFVTEVQGANTDAARAEILAERFSDQIEKGDPIGRIEIDIIGIDFVLLNGTDTATLQKGPGRYPQTPLPGLGGDDRDRGPPDHLRRAIPQDQRDRGRRRDQGRAPLRRLHLHGPEARDRRPERRRDRRARRLRPRGPHGLPPALQRRAALRRLRQADRDPDLRRLRRGRVARPLSLE